MKKYENPMLQVISVKSNDILTNSPVSMGMIGDYNGSSISIAAPDRFNDYYEGF